MTKGRHLSRPFFMPGMPSFAQLQMNQGLGTAR